MGVDRESEGRKVQRPSRWWATGLGGRRRWAGRPRPCVGNVTGELSGDVFRYPYHRTPFFFPWVSLILVLIHFWVDFGSFLGVDFLGKPVVVVGKFCFG